MNALALTRKRHANFSDDEWRFCLRQIEGRQRARHKLPEIAADDRWLYPARLSMEQCSSEQTAKYKQQIVRQTGAEILADLTGGFGIDCHYMGEAVREVHYVEHNEELCRIAEHNLRLDGRDTHVHHAEAEEFMRSGEAGALPKDGTLLYLDPARRAAGGGRVFRIEDCEPDAGRMLPLLLARANHIIIKLSPMLDLTSARRSLGNGWQFRIVAVGGEVKEVLAIHSPATGDPQETVCTDLKSGMVFRFTQEEEKSSECLMCSGLKAYIYEPDMTIMKAGAYKLAGARYGLEKLADNTHLYTSDRLTDGFPGRIFRITDEKPQRGERYNIITRNHPLKPEQLAAQLHVREGGSKFIIGTRTGNKAVVITAERV